MLQLLLNQRRHPTLYTLISLALLFLAVWLPRALQLDTFVTIDERRWLSRSANYYTGITHGDLGSTSQTDHPGVTVMWAGTLGFIKEYPEYASDSEGQIDYGNFEYRYGNDTEHELLDLLAAGRWWIALAASLLIALSFLPLREVYDTRIAIFGVLFMGWAPFHMAHSRFLHLDGLLSALVAFSLLAFIAWGFGQRKTRYLVISGITFGLAVLTKMPAIFLAPGVGAITLLIIVNDRRQSDVRAGRTLLGLLGWGVIAVCTIALLWPALWLDPVGLITQLVTGARTYVAGHSLPNFFMGEITHDPGPTFYPVAYLFRTTPITLIGLIAALVAAAKMKWPLDTDSRRFAMFGLLVFALLFTLGLMTAAKKFDRYLLPIFLPLDVVASLGWAALARLLAQWWRQRRASGESAAASRTLNKTSMPVIVLLAVVVLLQGLMTFNHFPYYLSYYNPLLGGNKKALNTMVVGWGEGLDQAAAWINEQEGGDQAQVVSWYRSGPLSYFLDSDRHILHFEDTDFWVEADYAVTYINQWQRVLPNSETLTTLDSLEPVYTVQIKGLDMAEVYDLRQVPPPESTGISISSAAQCNEQLLLAAHKLEEDSLIPGAATKVTLFLKTLSPVEARYQLHARLASEQDESLWHFDQPVGITALMFPTTGFEHIELDVAIPSDANPGDYTLSVACLAPGTTGSLAENQDAFLPVTTITVLPIHEVDLETAWTEFELSSLRHQHQVKQGDPLGISLSARGNIDGMTKISMRLLDAKGEKVAQQDRTLERDMQFDLSVPEELPPGRFAIAVMVYEPESLHPIPDILGNELIPLSMVEVVSP